MTATEIAQDGSTVLHTLTAPGRGFAAVLARRRPGLALALSTAAALATAAVIVPRTDFGTAAQQRLLRGPPGADEPTPYQLEEAAATATKLGHVAGYAGALLSPALAALLAAAALFVGFRVAGTRPGFKPTLAVTAHALLPIWLGGLLAVPATIARAPLPLEDAGRLVPSSLAAWAGPLPPPLSAALSAVDLFTLWAVALVALGMARASGASRARALAVTAVLFLAYVALLKVVPAGVAAGAAAPG